MTTRVTIRSANREDHAAIARLRIESLLGSSGIDYTPLQVQQLTSEERDARLLENISEGCVLLGMHGGLLVACNSLELSTGRMSDLYVKPRLQGRGIGRRMVVEIERLAVRFGMASLDVEVFPAVSGFYRSCQYQPKKLATIWRPTLCEMQPTALSREFPRRQTRYGARIRRLHARIGIPDHYGRKYRLMLQEEARELATIGTDYRGREQMLLPEAAMAWYALRNAAEADGVILQAASAYRSVGYQTSIIERKKQAGQSIRDILRVSAAPGYSEHHTGRAIDITSPDSQAFEESFETTLAFEWLTESAREHGFNLSYPRNNRHGIAYEPWHWAWTG